MSVEILKFEADWCAPCKALRPVWEELEGNFSDKATFQVIDIDIDSDTAAKYNITSVPTVVIVKNGEITDHIVGLVKKDRLEEALNKVI